MPVQQQKPRTRGLPPVLMSFTMSVLSPMAAMAMMMKNLLSSLSGENTVMSAPAETDRVVIRDAPTKNRMKKGFERNDWKIYDI